MSSFKSDALESKRVIDVTYLDGKKAEKTYLKRAKGLVKGNKAKWDKEDSIILLKNKYESNSIYMQAMFWYKNIDNKNNSISELLENIYLDYYNFERFEQSEERSKSGANINNLKNYQELTNTLDLLYSISVLGDVAIIGNDSCLVVDKLILKNHYKNNIKNSIDYLTEYGFEFLYFNEETAVDNLLKANKLVVYFTNNSSLIFELSDCAKVISSKRLLKDQAYNEFLFYMNDINGSLLFDDLLDERILNTIGKYYDTWSKLVNEFSRVTNFNFTINLHPYVSPFYSIAFYIKKKKVALFRIQVDELLMYLPVNDVSKTSRFNGCGFTLGNDVTSKERNTNELMIDITTMEITQILKILK